MITDQAVIRRRLASVPGVKVTLREATTEERLADLERRVAVLESIEQGVTLRAAQSDDESVSYAEPGEGPSIRAGGAAVRPFDPADDERGED